MKDTAPNNQQSSGWANPPDIMWLHAMPLRTCHGTQYARDLIIRSTIGPQSVHPDIRLHGGDVVWSGDETPGFHCSLRMIHDSAGSHGPPSGRNVRPIGFSHHLVRNRRIAAEWTVFDEFSLLKQIYVPEPATTRTSDQQATEPWTRGGRVR